MAKKTHLYRVGIEWTGNRGTGTSSYTAYGREHVIKADGNPDIPASSDPAFRGDASRWNPEELLVGALAACHKLWYLHLCAVAKIVVVAYRDEAEGVTEMEASGEGRFVSGSFEVKDPPDAQSIFRPGLSGRLVGCWSLWFDPHLFQNQRAGTLRRYDAQSHEGGTHHQRHGGR